MKRGALAESDPDLAAMQFHALIKDGVFWPTLLGAQELGILSDVERILDESVTLFLTRYGASG